MTFAEIVSSVQDRLNLTSSASSTRVGTAVNKHYKRLTSALGISHTSRSVFNISANTTIGSAEVTFTSVEKLNRVYYLSGTQKVWLDEVLADEIREENPPTNDSPTKWAYKALGDSSVTVLLDSLAATSYALKADGFITSATLSGVMVPAFPESYHDILIEGVLKDEYKKMEKLPLAKESKAEYEQRLSDLRMWIAKSGYVTIRQGERAANSFKPFTYK